MPLKLTTYYHGSDIPELPGNNTFHSIELFHIYEATPGYTPLSSDVRFMEQESILMKLSTKNLSLVRCCNG